MCSSIETVPYNECGLVMATFSLLQEHIRSHQTLLDINCQHCDFVAQEEGLLQGHMIEYHREIVILHTMAKQVDDLADGFASFETFKSDLSNVLKSLFDNQDKMMQKLSLIETNGPTKQEAKVKDKTRTENPSYPSSPPCSSCWTTTTYC